MDCAQISLDQQLHLLKVLRSKPDFPGPTIAFAQSDVIKTLPAVSQQKRNRAKIVQNISVSQDRISSTYNLFVFQIYLFNLSGGGM